MGNNFEETMVTNPEDLNKKNEHFEDVDVLEPEEKIDDSLSGQALDQQKVVDAEKSKAEEKEVSQEIKEDIERQKKEEAALAKVKLEEIKEALLVRKNKKRGWLERQFVKDHVFEEKMAGAIKLVEKALEESSFKPISKESVRTLVERIGQQKGIEIESMGVDMSEFPKNKGKGYSSADSVGYEVMGK
jgi:hypothetical protein